MKTLYLISFISVSIFIFCKCENFDAECGADIAVASLDAPGSVISGNPIEVICVIKNLIQTATSCLSTSNPGTTTVSCAYSPTYQDRFSEYAVFDVETFEMLDSVYIAGQVDKMIMNTNQGAGYYAMKVEVDSPIDDNSENNAQAISIRAD